MLTTVPFISKVVFRLPTGIAHLRAFCACDLLHFRTYQKLFVKLDTPFWSPFTFDVDTSNVIVFGIKVLRRNINLGVVVANNVLLLPYNANENVPLFLSRLVSIKRRSCTTKCGWFCIICISVHVEKKHVVDIDIWTCCCIRERVVIKIKDARWRWMF